MTENTTKRKNKFVVPVLIIIGGLAVMFALISSRKKPEQAVNIFPGILVETMIAKPDSHSAVVTGSGTVRAKQEIGLAPQVNGRVDWVSEQFVNGGQFRKGDVLCRIEAIDYELAVEQSRARVVQMEYQLAVERAQADIARVEWARMQEKNTSIADAPDELVLRGPQLKQAEANFASAEAAHRQAELALERTRLRAPFDGRVKREMIDIGQTISAGTPVATIFSTDLVEIEVGIPVEELFWLEMPGSVAKVSMKAGGQSFSWSGNVVRTLGVLDSIGRMARVVVQIVDPYAIRADNGPELSIGSYVSVAISGRKVPNVSALPLFAVRSDNIVWIANPDSTLELRGVTPIFHSPDSVFVGNDIRAGERIVISGINGAANGLKLRFPPGGKL